MMHSHLKQEVKSKRYGECGTHGALGMNARPRTIPKTLPVTHSPPLPKEIPGPTDLIVSHVPSSKISVAGTNSAGSSIASFHHVQSNSAIEDDGPEDSSQQESSRICASIVPFGTNLGINKKTVRRGSRKITWEGDVSSESQGPVKKRSRLQRHLEASKIAPAQLLPLAPATATSFLLAQPTDIQFLNPLHVFVRQQIQVFTATACDMNQPAPGRKNRLQLNQVGLRCLHCAKFPPKDRVKRAICYPSKVSRVYHSVSDMKFDHFSLCKGLPEHLRQLLLSLKEDCKNSKRLICMNKPQAHSRASSSTAQYYHDTAVQMGMVDGSSGVFLDRDSPTKALQAAPVAHRETNQLSVPTAPLAQTLTTESAGPYIIHEMSCQRGFLKGKILPPKDHKKLLRMEVIPSFAKKKLTENTLKDSVIAMRGFSIKNTVAGPELSLNGLMNKGNVLLASQEDETYLNPIHCFVRNHVEYFIADENDISAPAPGRKTRIFLGQVGLRCIHCAVSGDRVKRSVCYPASVAGIYHSVSNMKFDHFIKCRGLPAGERSRFEALRLSCGRHGGRRVSSNKNSTAQYYQESARRLGLVDSETGIRFQEALTKTFISTGVSPLPSSNVATDGISALMIAASVRVAAKGNKTAV